MNGVQMLIVGGGVCPICGGGIVGIRRSSEASRLVLMCDECQAVWLDPGDNGPEAALFPEGPDFMVPGSTFSIASPASRWASRGEVVAAGWADYVTGEGEGSGRRMSAARM